MTTRILIFLTVLGTSSLSLRAEMPLPDARLDGNSTVPTGSTLRVDGNLTFFTGYKTVGRIIPPVETIMNGGEFGWSFPARTGTVAFTSDLSTYQPLNANLTAVSGLSTTGFLVLTASGVKTMTFSSIGGGLTVVGGNGQTGGIGYQLDYATQTDAVAGVSSAKPMSPATTRVAIDARPTVALFTVPLGGKWTDFELKGTLSNFGEHTPFTDLYLYYHSPDPARTSITSQTGPKPTVFFTDSGWTDHRRWRKQSANLSLWTMRSDLSATIPTAIAAVPVDATVKPTNATLVWSYCRISGTEYERDTAGRTIWHPIVPTWSTATPAP